MTVLPQAIENPYLLPLLLLAFLPLLLHLLDRRRARIVDWPAMRFFVHKSRARLRRLQIREALLILARSLAVLCIAYASLRPISKEVRLVHGGGAGVRNLVLIFDTSPSMAYRESAQGPSSLEKAKAGSLELLDSLSPASKVALITEHGAFERPGEISPDLESARKLIQALRPESGSFLLFSALDRAADLLGKLFQPPREVYVFTDLQKGILPEQDPAKLRFLADRLAASDKASARMARNGISVKPLSVRLMDCGSLHPLNRFVASLETGALAAGRDEPVAFKALLEASGGAGETHPKGEPIPVRLLAGNEEIEAKSVLLPSTSSASPGGGQPATAEFQHRFATSGWFQVSAELPPDGLREDDSRRLALEVFDRIPLLVVGTSEDGSQGGTARYVELALDPHPSGLLPPAAIFRAKFAAGLEEVDLSSYRVVIVTGLFALTSGGVGKLEAFVRGGGGLLLFGGSGTEAVLLSERLYRDRRGLLPARLASPIRAREEPLHPRDVATAHPALAVFKDPQEGDLSKISVRAWTQVSEVSKDAHVLARVNAESPWIVEKPLGKGNVILFTTSAAPDDSDLPLSPLFLPLLHKLVRYLAAGEGAAPLTTGDPIAVALQSNEDGLEGHVIVPGGARLRFPVSLENGELRATFRDTRAPGFYTLEIVRPGGQADRGLVAVVFSRPFAVNLPPEESRLERVSDGALGDLRSQLGLEVVRSARDAAAPSAEEEVKLEHWPGALALAVFLLFAELLLARSFARGREPWRRRGVQGQ